MKKLNKRRRKLQSLLQWKIASSYYIGRGHESKKMPCQDRTAKLVHFSDIPQKKSCIRRFSYRSKSTNREKSFYGLSLADGAGSCKHSDIGAEIITKKILEYIQGNFDYLYSYKTDNISKKLLDYIESKLKEISSDKKINLKDLSSTLLFVAIKDNKYIVGHIGDGVIGMLDKDNNLSTISHPSNGEFSNVTFFTTSLHYPERLRIIKAPVDNNIGFILMSDGSQESLYDKRRQKLTDINKSIINWLKNYDEKKVEDALHNNLKNVICKKTIDDCSIGIMRINKI